MKNYSRHSFKSDIFFFHLVHLFNVTMVNEKKKKKSSRLIRYFSFEEKMKCVLTKWGIIQWKLCAQQKKNIKLIRYKFDAIG